jgi:hypothetical protein
MFAGKARSIPYSRALETLDYAEILARIGPHLANKTCDYHSRDVESRKKGF